MTADALGDMELEQLITDRDRQTEARSRLRDLLGASPRTLSYQHWLRRLPDDGTREAIAVLASFTLETIDPFLQVEAYLSGWRVAATYFQYGQWQSALVAPDGPGRGGCSAAVVMLHDEELLGPANDPAEAATRLESLLRAFRNRTQTPLLLGIIDAPPQNHSIAFGECGSGARRGARSELRRRIDEFARQLANVHLIDIEADVQACGDWYDPRAYFSTRSVLTHRALAPAARSIARTVGALIRPRRKVLVIDLDNTLWGGVVGEDGIEGVSIGDDWPGAAFSDFQRELLRLRSTGILLAIASKNEQSDAQAVFEQRPGMVLSWSHFSAVRVNWKDKPSNIREIADELGLGLESFVFADDSPIECALVRRALPQVEVVELGKDPSHFMDRVLRTQAFDVLHVSEEDRQRADSYAAEADRRTLKSQVTDLRSFLADCDLRLSIRPLGPKTLERVHQLMGKTNQFNFTLERLSKEALADLIAEDQVFTSSLVDRFGDYGLVGFLILRQDAEAMSIVNMALSCRALGRGVEDAMLAFARERALSDDRARLAVTCVRGPRNQQVLDYLEKAGFSQTRSGDQRVVFSIALSNGALPWPPHVHVERATVEERIR